MTYPVDYDPVQVRRDSVLKIIKRDSIDAGFFFWSVAKIDKLDINRLSIDEIIEKYHIKGFANKIVVKQSIKFGKQGIAPALTNFAGKSTWISIFTIIPAAWLLLLMYRHQNRLYVEHIIFLIHITCLGFLTSSLMLLSDVWGMYITMAVDFIVLIFALKRVYMQAWGKTIAKGLIYYIFHLIFSTVISLLGFLLSLVFS